MNMQTVTSTDIQRNFASILSNLDEPLVVIRDSKPEAVFMTFDEYQNYQKNKKTYDMEKLLSGLREMHKANSHISEKEMDKDIDEALKYVRSHRNRH